MSQNKGPECETFEIDETCQIANRMIHMRHNTAAARCQSNVPAALPRLFQMWHQTGSAASTGRELVLRVLASVTTLTGIHIMDPNSLEHTATCGGDACQRLCALPIAAAAVGRSDAPAPSYKAQRRSARKAIKFVL